MFFRSIQWRLILILSFITFTLMTVVWVFMNFQVERSFYDSFKDDIARNYDNLQITETMSTADLENVLRTNPVITGLILGEYKSFTMVDKESGSILYSSDPVYQNSTTQDYFRAAIFKSVNLLSVMGGEVEGTNPKHTVSRVRGLGDFYDYVRLQPLSDKTVILFFKYSRDKAVALLDKFNGMILLSILVALLSALGIGLLLSRTITKPITDVMHKAESITAGEFGQLLEVKSMDEIGKLTDTFNFMSVRLKNMLTEISAEKNKVETVINHITAGILAFDRNGLAIHINHAAGVLLSDLPKTQAVKNLGNPMQFSSLMKVLGCEVRLADLFLETVEATKPVILPIADKFIRIQFAAFGDRSGENGGVILVLQDMTEEQRLENMRREFVANVSHELRTPLTSVKSYTETLIDGAAEDKVVRDRFLRIINEETDRMVRLVKDLLVLSSHDSGLKIVFSEVDPDVLVQSCVERLRHAAAEKNQNLTVEKLTLFPEQILLQGDFDRLEQLLLNIVGNAIKYTPANGTVRIAQSVEGKWYVIRVHDTGMGIPKADLQRIFERFYRVDKARSRQMGGTGLGLAIAKEIAEIHGGDILAESKMNEGTTIQLRLPVPPYS